MMRTWVEERKYVLLAFALSFVVGMIVNVICNVNQYYYDAENYWNRAIHSGGDVTQMGTHFRGYVFSIFLWAATSMGKLLFDWIGWNGAKFGFWIVSALVFGWLFSFGYWGVLSSLFERKRMERRDALLSVLAGIVFLVLFYGVLIYPLTDLYAFALSVGVLLLIEKLLAIQDKKWFVGISALIGFLCYATYNIRTAYVFFGGGCIAGLLLYYLIKKKWRNVLCFAVGCFTGLFLCAIPQYIQNQAYGVNSFRIQEMEYGEAGSLFLFHLSYGIKYDRTDTFVGNIPDDYISPMVCYDDKQGRNLLQEKLEGKDVLDSAEKYFELAINHPLILTGIYGRHFLNILYPVFPEIYIRDMGRPKVLNLVLFFLLGASFIRNMIKCDHTERKRFFLTALFLPCIVALPTFVEVRYFIALYFLICCVGVYGLRDALVSWRGHAIRNTIFLLIGFVLYYAYGGYMISSIVGDYAIYL